jgi:hypothetical protein
MEPEKKSNGAFIGLIVIIIILILGGIYIWITNKNAAEKIKSTQAESQAVTNQNATALDALGSDIGTTDTNVSTGVNSVN